MNCLQFQNSISDYVEGALDPRERTECAGHRLVCRDCRELYSDVRAMMRTLSAVSSAEVEEPEGLQHRILNATTTGEMLSCGEFDRMLERYFDGVILGPTFQNFQSHFADCGQCRRLFAGIEDAIAMCRDAKEVEIEVPATLNERIVAATSGPRTWRAPYKWMANAMRSPQLAVAALIIAAASLLIISRFGSVEGVASHAEDKARRFVNQGQLKLSGTGARARVGFQSVSSEMNSLLFDGNDQRKPAAPATERPHIHTGSARARGARSATTLALSDVFMYCSYHPIQSATAHCTSCGRPLCQACDHRIKGRTHCQDCIVAGIEHLQQSRASNQAERDAKSPLGALLLGLMPGLGAAYNGQTIKALVHFSAVAGLIVLADIFNGPLEVIFSFGAFGFYLYSLYDAQHAARRQRRGEDLRLEDERLKASLRSHTNLWGSLLIALGVVSALKVFLPVQLNRFWPLLLVLVGTGLLYLFRSQREHASPPPKTIYRTPPPSVISSELDRSTNDLAVTENRYARNQYGENQYEG